MCSKEHPSVLHVKQLAERAKQVENIALKAPDSQSSTAPIHPKACGHIGAGTEAANVLSVVPEKVKAGKGQKVIHVYAFIDPGRTDTFYTERLMP